MRIGDEAYGSVSVSRAADGNARGLCQAAPDLMSLESLSAPVMTEALGGVGWGA